MKPIMKLLRFFILFSLVQLTGNAAMQKQNPQSDQVDINNLKTKFLQLCDVAIQELNLPERKLYSPISPKRRPQFYIDSYVVRALAVAYDLTGKEEYLSTIKDWSDRMITFQEKMIPKGAYYMNYGRGPYETAGGWYNGDSGSIGMGVLATAIRCTNPIERLRYIKSVESYANLVLENYIGPEGGIRDGIYPKYEGEWYCSSGTVGSMFFLLYNETDKQDYLDAGLNAVNWLSKLDINNSTDEFVPTLNKRMESRQMMYFLEAYSAGLPHIISKNYPEIEELARKRIALLMKWNSENLCTKGQSGNIEKYDAGRQGAIFGGLPFHIYVHKQIIDSEMFGIADKELKRIIEELFARDEQLLTEFACFAMMSMAERISPGSIYRKSKPLYKLVGSSSKN